MSAAWMDIVSELGVLLSHEVMGKHTTLGVGGPARWFFRPRDRQSLVEAMAAIPMEVAMMPLGRGSNVLVSDTGFDGLVIDLSDLSELLFDGCLVRAEAGVRMSRFSRQCADHGLSGCEFMATVPGDIGGGVAMNAGCFSQQVSDSLEEITVLLRDGREIEIEAAALELSYRHTALPAGALVLEAVFRLHPDNPDQVRERMRSMRSRRSATQPLSLPNCGSVFKNPDGDHAARLIEAAGLKGFAIGGAKISEQHANFIVNEGDASGADILGLIRRAQRVVKEQFDIELEPEVRMIGEWM